MSLPVKKPSFKNITQPEQDGYQVRVVRNRKEYSRYFPFKKFGDQKKALAAANVWRDEIKSNFNGNTEKRKLTPSSNNKSTGVLGVCRTISWDRRKDLKYLIFQVAWTDFKGKKHNKSFRVCNIDFYDKTMEAKALKAAKAFRRDWENHCDNNTLKLFDPLNYLHWREMTY